MVEARTRELQKAQAELLVKERLAVLGHFAGSISHEIRNPLAVIDTAAYFVKLKLAGRDEKLDQHLGRIQSNVKKITDIIESLLNLTRMEKPRTKPQALAELIEETLGSCKIPESVAVVKKIPADAVRVEVDVEQIRMAVKNLVNNAVQAMDGEGTLTLTGRVVNGDRVELLVSDTGPGIPAEQLESVFEPLFTTKAQGIGFGLSITKMIIEKHGGTIRADAAPDDGAAFTLTLPLAERRRAES
jgi:signal transduction histidine kinase